MKESTNVTPGDRIPPLLEIDGLKIGLMTCYDVRFRKWPAAWCWTAPTC